MPRPHAPPPNPRALARLYGVALIFLVLLGGAGQMYVHGNLEDCEADAHLINLAGRQRMLSQRIARAALDLRRPGPPPRPEPAVKVLEGALEEWTAAHHRLWGTGPDPGLVSDRSPALNRMLLTLEPTFRSVERGARALIEAERTRSVAGPAPEIDPLLRDIEQFLGSMEQVVGELEQRAQLRVQAVRHDEHRLFGMIVLVLGLEGALLFWPTMRALDHMFQAMHASEKTARERCAETERTLALLRESEARFRLFIDHSPALAFIKDETGRYLFMNQHMENLFGRRFDPDRPPSDADLVPPEMVAKFRAHDLEVLSTGRVTQFLEDGLDDDGKLRHWAVWRFPLETGARSRLIGGVAVDLTEREQTARLQARLEAVVDCAQEAILAADRDGRIFSINRAAEHLLGYPEAEVIGRHGSMLVPQDLAPATRELMGRVMQGERVHGLETVRLHRDGRRIEVCFSAAPILDAAGRFDGFSVTMHDIGKRKQLEREQARLLAILEATPDIVATVTPRGGLRYVNQAGRRLLGISDHDPLPLEPGAFARVHPAWAVKRLLEIGAPTALRAGHWEGETAYVDRDGTEIPHSQLVLAHRNGEGRLEYYSTIARDISERKRLEQLTRDQMDRLREYADAIEAQKRELEAANAGLEALATTDPLTGLKNRRVFQDRIEHEVSLTRRHGRPLSIVLIDVDHFKPYNDAFGHPAGDEVLARIGRLLTQEARRTDCVARYGGEEFVLVLPSTDREGALVMAERLRAAIVGVEWPLRQVTASFGVATWREGMAQVEDLIAAADGALYRAKREGRNRVCHEEGADGPPPASRAGYEGLEAGAIAG